MAEPSRSPRPAVPAQTKASRGPAADRASNPILEDAFIYEIRVTKSIRISAPGSGCTRIARLRPQTGAGIVLPRHAKIGSELPPHPGDEREMRMKRSRVCALLLAIAAATAPWCGASAQDHLKVAVGARGVGETFVAEL